MSSSEANEPEVPAPTENPPPLLQPSRATAGWLVLTLLNIGLLVFLVPVPIFDSPQAQLLAKVLSTVVAAGAFAAGVLFFKMVLLTLPEQRWFKISNVIALGILILLHVSQQNVVSIYPRIDPEGATLIIDEQPRAYEAGGKVGLAIHSHTVKIRPQGGDTGKEPQDGVLGEPEYMEREFEVKCKDVFLGIFTTYSPRWGLLYRVTIYTRNPNVEVRIHKKDDAFDTDFLQDTLARDLRKLTPGSTNDLVYRGTAAPLGSSGVIYLPYGEYVFTASMAGCLSNQTQPPKPLFIGTDRMPYEVAFSKLCEQ